MNTFLDLHTSFRDKKLELIRALDNLQTWMQTNCEKFESFAPELQEELEQLRNQLEAGISNFDAHVSILLSLPQESLVGSRAAMGGEQETVSTSAVKDSEVEYRNNVTEAGSDQSALIPEGPMPEASRTSDRKKSEGEGPVLHSDSDRLRWSTWVVNFFLHPETVVMRSPHQEDRKVVGWETVINEESIFPDVAAFIWIGPGLLFVFLFKSIVIGLP